MIVNNCQKMLKYCPNCQKIVKIVKKCKICQILSKLSKNSQNCPKLPKIVKTLAKCWSGYVSSSLKRLKGHRSLGLPNNNKSKDKEFDSR